MALRVTLGGRLAAARARLIWTATPDRWLIRLRWLALIGMLITTLVAELLVPGLPSHAILMLLGGIVAINAAWWVMTLRAPSGSTVAWQLALDVLLLGGVLWLSGGLDNPFSGFLVFQIVLSGLLARRRTTILIAGLAIVVAACLWTAPPLPLETAPLGPWAVRSLGNGLATVALAIVTGVFVVVFLYRLEVLRERSARSERLAELGRVVATLCHELNTPLGTILIAGKDLGHVARDLDGDARGEVEGLAGTVVDQARRASDIISLLRGHVSPDTQTEAIALDDFLPRYVKSELQRLGYGGALGVEVEAGLEPLVFRVALCQILTNLLTNAVDAMRDLPRPKLEVRATRGEGDTVLLAVVDEGPGVDPSLGDRLGEPFLTTKPPDRGTGLGLYVSTMLAERMGGALALDSRRGRGTRVVLTLKAVASGDTPARAAAPAREPAPQEGGAAG